METLKMLCAEPAQGFIETLKQKPDVQIAFFALLVSITAIVLTIVTALMQRKHNRLSVLPLASIDVLNYETKIAVILVNNGNGPLIISKLEVTGNTSTAGKVFKDLYSAMPAEMKNNTFFNTFVADPSGESLRPGDKLELILKKFNNQHAKVAEGETKPTLTAAEKAAEQKIKEDLRAALKGLHLELTYTDIYGSKIPPATRNLDTFGNTIPLS